MNRKLSERSEPAKPFSWIAAVFLAGSVGGCAGVGDETLNDALIIDPGKYTPYNCLDIDNSISTTTARVTELEQLISRASQGTGGTVMAAVAYHSEYKQTRAQLRALKRLAADKQCVANSEYLSRRSVY